MKTVWKFPLVSSLLSLPAGAEILSVQTQNGEPQLWAVCDTDAVREDRILRIFGTGQPLPPYTELNFIDTFQLQGGALVFHVFEELR